ncbi:MAG: ABC transporter permease, partial [Longicatena sp.]
MKHILLYRCKVMMRNRTLVFWSIIFPIVLMTLFGLILRQSFQYTSFDTVPVAIVENESWDNNTALQTVLKEAKSEDTPL